MSEEMENEVRKEASRILEAAGIEPKVVETCVNLSIDGYKTAERVLVPRLIDSAWSWIFGNLFPCGARNIDIWEKAFRISMENAVNNIGKGAAV